MIKQNVVSIAKGDTYDEIPSVVVKKNESKK